LPDLKIANPLEDLEILKAARLSAYGVIKADPGLNQVRHRYLREYVDFGLFSKNTAKPFEPESTKTRSRFCGDQISTRVDREK
jgi:hypothetical protein